MIHLVKCVLSKPKDPEFVIPITHINSYTWRHMLPIPGLSRQRRVISGLTGQLA